MKKTLKKILSVFLSLVMTLSCVSVMGSVFTFKANAGGVTVSAHYQYYTPGYWNDESTLYLTNADGGTNANYVIGEGYDVNYLYAYGDYSAGGTIYYNNAYATKYVDYRTNKTIDSLDMYVHFNNSPVISCYPWTRVEQRTEGCDWYIYSEANVHGIYTYDNAYYKLNGGSKNDLPSSGSVDLWVQSRNIVLGPSSDYIGNSIWWKGHQHYNTIYITFYMHDTTALYNEVYAASTQTAVNNGSALYTADSWAAFISAYNNAAARLTNTNDQSLINAAQSELVNARNALVRIYTVKFTDDANNVLSTQSLVAGTAPTVPSIPAKAPDTVNHYTANGWDSEVTAANADKTYKAVYTVTAHSGMDDFICDVCNYYDAAGALADAKTKAAAAITEAAGSAPSYGVEAVVQYALARISNATTIEAVNGDKENALAAINVLVNDKTAALAEAEAALAAAQTALTEAQTALTEKTAALNETQTALNTANAALTDAQTQIDTLTAALTEKETALTEANAALTEAQNAKAALEVQLAEKETALAALQDTVDADADDIAALEADIAALEADITEKEGVITAKTNEITALEATVAANETAIAAAETQISTLTSDLAAAQMQVETLTAALAEANTALAAKDEALAAANAELATANAALTTANAQISSLNDELSDKTAALTVAEGNLATANAALTSAQSQIDGLTGTLAAANDALAAKETALTEAQTALAAAENEKAALETQLSAKETELAALQNSVAANADEIAALENDIDVLEAAIAEKDAAITAKNNEIDTLKAGAAAYETAIAEAENEIAAKETEIASLRTRLNKALSDIEALKEGTYVEPEDDGTCIYCGKVHENVFDKFFCMLIRFFDFIVSVFEFSSAT